MIRLKENFGDLYLGDDLLLVEHPEGDYDSINAADPDHAHLRSALYAARECGDLPMDCAAVTLPSGEVFRIDGDD